MVEVATDVTVAAIDEMDPIHGGVARRARAQLGVTAWGMQVLTLPPNWEDYPNHNHDATAFDPNQEEVYIPLSGSATLVAGEQRFELVPGAMARVGRSSTGRSSRAGRDPAARARRQAGHLRRSLLDRARRTAAGRRVASAHGAADGRRGRRRAGVRAADGAAAPPAARALLPDARLGARRRRRAPGDDAPRLARPRPLRAARGAVVVVLPDRHQRLPADDRAARPPRGRGDRRLPAAVSGRTARDARGRGRAPRVDRARLRRGDAAPTPAAARGARSPRRSRLVGARGRGRTRHQRRRREQRAAARSRTRRARATRGHARPPAPAGRRAGGVRAHAQVRGRVGGRRRRAPDRTPRRRRADDDAARADARGRAGGDRRLLRDRADGGPARPDPPAPHARERPAGARRVRPGSRRPAVPRLRDHGLRRRGRPDRRHHRLRRLPRALPGLRASEPSSASFSTCSPDPKGSLSSCERRAPTWQKTYRRVVGGDQRRRPRDRLLRSRTSRLDNRHSTLAAAPGGCSSVASPRLRRRRHATRPRT